MAKMQWDVSLSVGVDLIDEQHKMWIGRLGELSRAIEAHQVVSESVRALEFLIEYTKLHFSTEEDAMDKHAYPGVEEHKQKHEELRTTLAGLEQDFREDGLTPALTDAVNNVLLNWLVNHIKTIDVAFGAFLKEKGIVITGEVS